MESHLILYNCGQSTMRVLVLLAAYNGERWIREQVDSIFNQDGVSVDILCSVDLSSDQTLEILKSYNNDNIRILPYGKVFGGAGPNFYHLIREANFTNYDYIALADQDDIWLNDKISYAISSMEEEGAKAFSSDVTAFWADGATKLIKKSYNQTSYDHFFESPGPGCSFVLAADLALELQKFITSSDESSLIDLHDWLIYAYVRSGDHKWLIGKEPKLLYRQHEDNQCGANSGLSGLRKRLKIMGSGWYAGQVLKLLKLFDPDSKLYKRLERLHSVDRIFLFLASSKFRRKNKEKILLSIAILLRIF